MCVRKNARNGETSNVKGKQIGPSCSPVQATPKNTKKLKDTIKTDRVRPKRVKTRFVRARTEGGSFGQNK